MATAHALILCSVPLCWKTAPHTFSITRPSSSSFTRLLSSKKCSSVIVSGRLWMKPSHFSSCQCKGRKDSANPEVSEMEKRNQKALQVALWVLESVYVCWLFLLPYAPGDPVWAIKPETISVLLDLSLNFFFILPIANTVGLHFMEAPILHPTTEALFNFVIGWTLMFAPLLFTDKKKEKFRGSLEVLWVVQMFLTNTFLIPYMAFRLGESGKTGSSSQKPSSGFQAAIVSSANVIAAVGLFVGIVSVAWALYGRGDAGFGDLSERWNFFLDYIKSDRPAYAFIWDIILYSLFQPWLIGDNLQNVEKSKVKIVHSLRFVPYVGLVAYLWGLS